MELTPGEVWWAKPDPTVGREQSDRRPVLVVAGADFLRVMDTLALVVPLTTVARGWANHVPVRGEVTLPAESFAMTEQLRTVSRDRLESRVGLVSPACLRDVRSWIRDFLAG